MKWIIGVSILAVAVGVAVTMTVPAETIALDQEILKLFPAETQGIAFIDVAQLREAPLAQEILADSTVSDFRALRDFAEATGFVVQRDLNRLTIGRIGTHILAVAEAHYNAARVERFFMDKGFQTENYMGRTIYNRDSSTVTLTGDMAIAGDSENVKKAIGRLSGSSSVVLKPGLLTGIQTREAGNQVWAVGELSLDEWPIPPAANGPALNMLKTLQSGTYQMKVDQDLHARATGNLVDSESAKDLADLGRGMIALAKLQVARQSPDLLHALDGVQIQNSGSSVVVDIVESGELLKKLRNLRPKTALAR